MRVPLLLAVASLVSLASLAAVAGCGGKFDVAASDDAGAGDGATDGVADSTYDSAYEAAESSSDEGLDTPDGPSSCPPSEPTAGTKCNVVTGCTYPPFASAVCKSSPAMWRCDAGVWAYVCTAIPDSGTDTGPPACPATMPGEGGPCAPIGRVCGYGEDPRPSCRSSAKCTGTGWSIAITGCPPPPTAVCPSSADTARGTSCTEVGAFCSYPGSIECACGNCFGGPCGGSPRWVCDGPPGDSACPRHLPNLGLACPKDGLNCLYGSCGAGDIADRQCTGGVWVDTPVGCPA